MSVAGCPAAMQAARNAPLTFSCHLCPSQLRQYVFTGLQEHMSKEHFHGFALYRCPKCNEEFTSAFLTHHHIRQECKIAGYLPPVNYTTDLLQYDPQYMQHVYRNIEKAIGNRVEQARLVGISQGMEMLKRQLSHSSTSTEGHLSTETRSPASEASLPRPTPAGPVLGQKQEPGAGTAQDNEVVIMEPETPAVAGTSGRETRTARQEGPQETQEGQRTLADALAEVASSTTMPLLFPQVTTRKKRQSRAPSSAGPRKRQPRRKTPVTRKEPPGPATTAAQEDPGATAGPAATSNRPELIQPSCASSVPGEPKRSVNEQESVKPVASCPPTTSVTRTGHVSSATIKASPVSDQRRHVNVSPAVNRQTSPKNTVSCPAPQTSMASVTGGQTPTVNPTKMAVTSAGPVNLPAAPETPSVSAIKMALTSSGPVNPPSEPLKAPVPFPGHDTSVPVPQTTPVKSKEPSVNQPGHANPLTAPATSSGHGHVNPPTDPRRPPVTLPGHANPLTVSLTSPVTSHGQINPPADPRRPPVTAPGHANRPTDLRRPTFTGHGRVTSTTAPQTAPVNSKEAHVIPPRHVNRTEAPVTCPPAVNSHRIPVSPSVTGQSPVQLPTPVNHRVTGVTCPPAVNGQAAPVNSQTTPRTCPPAVNGQAAPVNSQTAPRTCPPAVTQAAPEKPSVSATKIAVAHPGQVKPRTDSRSPPVISKEPSVNQAGQVNPLTAPRTPYTNSTKAYVTSSGQVTSSAVQQTPPVNAQGQGNGPTDPRRRPVTSSGPANPLAAPETPSVSATKTAVTLPGHGTSVTALQTPPVNTRTEPRTAPVTSSGHVKPATASQTPQDLRRPPVSHSGQVPSMTAAQTPPVTSQGQVTLSAVQQRPPVNAQGQGNGPTDPRRRHATSSGHANRPVPRQEPDVKAPGASTTSVNSSGAPVTCPPAVNSHRIPVSPSVTGQSPVQLPTPVNHRTTGVTCPPAVNGQAAPVNSQTTPRTCPPAVNSQRIPVNPSVTCQSPEIKPTPPVNPSADSVNHRVTGVTCPPAIRGQAAPGNPRTAPLSSPPAVNENAPPMRKPAVTETTAAKAEPDDESDGMVTEDEDSVEDGEFAEQPRGSRREERQREESERSRKRRSTEDREKQGGQKRRREEAEGAEEPYRRRESTLHTCLYTGCCNGHVSGHCGFCFGRHKSEDCGTYTELEEREISCLLTGYCYHCLNHRGRERCPRAQCQFCKRTGHPSALCRSKENTRRRGWLRMSRDIHRLSDTEGLDLHLRLRQESARIVTLTSGGHYRWLTYHQSAPEQQQIADFVRNNNPYGRV